MTKRILIGKDGSGNFRIRASAAGHNVETAPLDQILFDADAVPGRVITQGARYCHWNIYQPSQNRVAEHTTFAHGVPAGMNFIIAAIAKPLLRDDATPPNYSEPQDWLFWQFMLVTPESTTRILNRAVMNNPSMERQYCTPHRFEGDDGKGFAYWGGWWVSWDAVNITVTNNCGHGLWVRWQALEV